MGVTGGDGASGDPGDLGAIVARRLGELRKQRQWSLEALARSSGVSRAMLWQIEQGRSAPTLKLLGRIAASLDVPLTALLYGVRPDVEVLRAADAKHLSSADGGYVSRALFPFTGVHAVEFYEIRLAPGAEERAEAHAAGTLENLVVNAGAVEIEVAGEIHRLAAGDAIHFRADQAHAYRNTGSVPALLYLVMSYPGELNYG
ncbi:XRE family transcriptional regulator [Pseudoxanthomonas putridarboris]